MSEISFWEQRVKTARELDDHKKYREDRAEARDFYEGNQITQDEEEAWGGDTVVANLFRRSVNFITDAIYSDDPSVRTGARRNTQEAGSQYAADAVQKHILYLFEEMEIGVEIYRTLKDSWFGNISSAEIDFDKTRQLWRIKWIAGEVVCDPDAHGDVSRARWIAKHVRLPRYRVYQNKTFDKEARAKLREKQNFTTGGDAFDEKALDLEDNGGGDYEDVWYIYSQEGVTPLENEDDTPQPVLLVMAENLDVWLLKKENPTPWLYPDEYPIEVLRIDEMPGKFNGPAPWRQQAAACKNFNWAASYHQEDMRKTASRAIAYDEDRIDDASVLDGRQHMRKIPVTGDPSTVLSPMNFGQADKTIFESVKFWGDMNDKVSGIDEIARGEEGVQKTATESEILQKNSSITLRGPSRSMDRFLAGIVKKLGLVSLYYTPAFSVTVDQTGMLITRKKVEVPQTDPMTGLPVMDQMGVPVMETQLQVVPVQWTPEEAAVYGAVIDEQELARVSPKQAGEYILKGIDYFHDDQTAMDWPDQMDFEKIKCDIYMKIDAGSSRATRKQERQKNAQLLLATVGADLKEIGDWEHYYEIMTEVVESFNIPDVGRKWPTKEEYVRLRQQNVMAMMAGPQGVPGQQPETGADPNAVGKEDSPGTMYPTEAPMTGE